VSHRPFPAYELGIRARRRRARPYVPAAAALVTALGFATAGGFSYSKISAAFSHSERAPAPAQADVKAASPGEHAWLLGPTPSLEAEALKSWRNAPLASTLQLAATQPDAITEPPVPPQAQERAQPVESSTAAQTTQTVSVAPLPVPRPAELNASPNVADRQVLRRTRTAALPAMPEDNRSVFEKFFGIQVQQPPGSALAYAAPDSGLIDKTPGRRLSPAPVPGAGPGIAVYDISARIVYMPNGERLEAHSGLGESMDDPRHVHLRMRGPTPPGTYDLTEREQLFHGVRALRLNPMGGSAAVQNRAGLLAHTYMLGPTGASNGCISFKDYTKFLQAYLRGEVRRIVVVSGRGQDGWPGIANKLFGMPHLSPDSRGDT